MANVLRIKRRATGLPGAPTSLANAEIAYNEVDHTLYYGEGTGGSGGSATVVVPVGGSGMASSALPVSNAVVANAGTLGLWSRGDHVHPSDITRAPLASPVFTGDPQAPTPATADNDTSVATTAFVKAQGYATSGSVPAPSATTPIIDGVANVGTLTTYSRGDHIHPTDTSRAPLANPIFTGDPQAPTPLTADNDTSIATTAFVKAQGYAPVANPVFTGDPQAVTQPNTDSDTSIATTAFVHSVRLDQLAVPGTDISWNNHKITALLDPSGPQDAATKNYVDSGAQGLITHASSRLGSTVNLSLTGLAAIDGVTPIAGDRILVKDQTTTSQNGIYVAASGAWTRALDADTWGELISAYSLITEGTVNANTGYVCNVLAGGTIGTTPVTWVQFSSAGQVIAGTGLTKTGSQIDAIGTAGRIAVFADNIDIDTTYVGQVSIITLGNVTTGTWSAGTIVVNRGGTGATTLTGYVKGTGTAALTGTATIPNTDITGLGTMSTQNANAVAVTGGTISTSVLSGDTLTGTTTNSGTIAGGTLSANTLIGTTTNSGTLTGGTISTSTLAGTITNSGTISGGEIIGSLGIDFGSALAAGGSADLSRHVALFGTNYGIGITSGRINYVSGGNHVFMSGTTDIITVAAGGLSMSATRTLTLAQDPTLALQAVTKQYVDAGTGAIVIASDTAPGSPKANQLWFDTVNAELYIWYNDGTSSQWVVANTVNAPQPGTISPFMNGVAAPGTLNPYARADHIHPSDTSRLATAGGVISGNLTVSGLTTLNTAVGITASTADNSTNLATTAFVRSLGYSTAVGTVTSITAGAGLSGGTITAAGTIAVATAGVTNAMLANMAASTIKGNNTAGLAAPLDLTVAQAQALLIVPGPSVTTPTMNGVATVGTLTTYAHGDHIHPTDISRVAAAGGTLTGGTLAGTTTNSGTISGGTISTATLLGTITNLGTLSGGTLAGSLTLTGTITGGTITGSLIDNSTFDCGAF